MSNPKSELPTPSPARVSVSEYRADAEPPSATLHIEYDGKVAYLELPMPPALYAQEPAAEVWRRELHAMMDSLDRWVRSNGGISV